jgi:hypothetical protein
MMKIMLYAAALTLTAATAHAGVNIIDNDQKLTVDCAKEKTVNIVGNNATVTLTGTCGQVNISGNEASVKGSAVRVNISGNESTLVLDAVDTLRVSGNENKISYKKGVKAKKPSVANSGTDNKISQVK